MSALRIAFRSLTRAQYIAIAIAMVTTLTAGLSRRAAAQDPLTDAWPPRLSEAYPDNVPGNELVKPIPPHVMKQMTEVVLKMADGALSHVDTLIDESKQIRNTHMLEEHAVFPHSLPYETSSLVVSFLNNAAGVTGKGISSISLVHAEMLRHRAQLKSIANRYENPIKIPSDADALEAFLKKQTGEAKAISSAVDWSMRGREYVAMWVLASLAYPDEELEKYQTRINEILQPKFWEKVNDDPTHKSLDGYIEKQIARQRVIFMDMARPYAAEEKRLIDHHVSRFMKLARYTKIMQDEIADQVVDFVDKTPPKWGEIPFSNDLFNPIRWTNDVLYPPDELDGFEGRGLVMLRVYFYVPDDIETPYGTVVLGATDVLRLNTPLALDWKVLFRPPNAPANELVKDEQPEYPKYTVYQPPTVPEVFYWGTGVPSPETDDWSHLIPQAVIDEHELNGRWIIMAVYGQKLFDEVIGAAALTWAAGDRHLSYQLLHSGTYSKEKVFGSEDPQWRDFWRGLHDRSESRQMAGMPALRIDKADVYIIAVHLGENTWAGQYQFNLGDLEINWMLPHATNIANTHFVRALGIGDKVPDWIAAVRIETGPDGRKMLYERADALFLYDQFFVEIETTGDVMTSDRIPFDLYRSRGEGAAEMIDYPDHPLYAVRVDKNRRLFRSPLMRLGDPRDTPGTSLTKWGHRVYWVPLKPGDRLAARVMPHDVARQGRMATSRMYTTPDSVSAFYREVVVEAAKIAKVDLPRPPSEMHDGELYLQVLKKPWETVDSTPFVRIGGREIKLNVEHLAAMLLIRKQFIASMEEAVPRLQEMRKKVNANPSLWGRNLWIMLKDDAQRVLKDDGQYQGSPLGDLDVPGWDPVRRITTRGSTVKYFNAYDEQWLNKTFRGLHGRRNQWQDKMALIVFNGYVGAAEDALDYARNMDMSKPDAKELLCLTAIGMRPVIDRLRPNMLRLVEGRDSSGIKFRWEYDRQARQSVALIERLGAEFIKNEARVDKINNTTQLVTAVVAIFLPETLVGQLIGAALNATSIAITFTRELPEYLGRENDVRFAIGAYLVIGQQKYVAADLRRKKGWMMALDIAGGFIDIRATLLQLSHARTAWVTMRSDAELGSLFAKRAEIFVKLPRATQKAALVRLAQLSEMAASGKKLASSETALLKSGTEMIDELGTLGRTPSTRYLDPKSIEGLEQIIMRDGSTGFVLRRKMALAGGSDTAGNAATDAKKLFSIPPQQRIAEQEPWHVFNVRDRIGHGGYAQVYEIPIYSRLKAIYQRLGIDAPGDIAVLKVYEAGQDGIDDVARAVETEKILKKAGIPQLRIIEHGVGPNNMAYLVQEIMPAPGLYKPVPGKMMDVDMQHALLEFHVKLGHKEIGFSDGWYANLYFQKLDDRSMICGILDQDRVWNYGKGLDSGAWQPEPLKGMLDMLRDPRLSGILSLTGCRYTPRAQLLIEMGYCPWPKGDFLMMKMLEHRGWIRFDTETRKFVSDRLDIKIVEDYFKRLNHPDSIDTKFDVPEHLRHLVPAPLPSNLPGGQSFNTLPFSEIMPWVTALRIAA